MATIAERINQLKATASANALTIVSLRARIEALEGGVTPAPTPVSISGIPPTTGAVGEPYSFIPVVANGAGTKTFTLANGVLLGGLVFSPSTGSISGSPTVAGTMSGIVVRVTDDTGSANTQATNITIAAATEVPQTPVPFTPAASQTFATSQSRTVDVGSKFQVVEFEATIAGWMVILGDPGNGLKGIGYRGRGEGEVDFMYADGSGGYTKAYDRPWVNGAAAYPGSKIRIAFDRNGLLTIQKDGVIVPDMTIDQSGNLGDYGNVVKLVIDGGEFRNVVVGPFTETITQGLYAPSINRAGKVEWDFLWSGSPQAFAQRVKNTSSGTIVSDWTPIVLTSNSAGKGTGTGTYVAARNADLTYELAPVKSDGTTDTSKVLSSRLIRPAATTLGQGFSVIKFTNKLVGVRMVGNDGNDFYAGNPDTAGTGAQFSQRGDPLVAGTAYQVDAESYFGPVTWELGCESGTLPSFDITGTPNLRNFTNPGGNPRRLQFTYDGDRRVSSMVTLLVQSVDANNPCVGLYLIKAGADKTKLFDVDWLEEVRNLPGVGRFMDQMLANNPFLFNLIFDRETGYQTFADRARINRIGQQLHGLVLEHMVLLCNELNIPMWINANVTWGYDYRDSSGNIKPGTGRDYGRKVYDLLFNGVGSDIQGLKLHSNTRHLVEPGNENWGSGLGSYPYLKQQYDKKHPGNSLGENEKVQHERTFMHANIMEDLESVVPDYATRVDRVFGLQMGPSDLINARGGSDWARANQHIDSYCKAPYLPGDPTQGFGSGQQPANLTPEGIVAWLRTYIRSGRATIEADVQAGLREGRPTHLYEFNVARAAIANMSAAQERAWMASAVYENFWRDEYLPACVLNTGGQTAVYKNFGVPVNADNPNSWYAYEGPEPWAGNAPWNALKYWAGQPA